MNNKENQLLEQLSRIQEGLEGLDRETSKMRLDADKLERALWLRKEREEYYKLKGKEIPTPRTYEETEGELPSIEFLATGFITKCEGDFRTKTRKEILEEGTLLEKLRLFYSSADLNNYFDGMDKTLSLTEMELVRDSIRTNKDAELAHKCTTEFSTISSYGKTLSLYYKRYQAVFGKLAVLLNRWDEYDRIVETYNNLQDAILKADYTDKPKPELYREHDLNFLGAKVLLLTKLEGAKIKRGEGTDIAFYLYIDGKGGLYTQIRRAAKEAREALSDFKAYVMAAEEYIESSTLRYTPISILMSTENVDCERYERYLINNPIYFRSSLSYKREGGETITPEEEKRAVIPYYYEVKATKQIYRDCKKGIKETESVNA